ncbi:MAG: cation transporter [Chloroflexi bacterium]|nr:cation transporter [Chloroflexota bacterium]
MAELERSHLSLHQKMKLAILLTAVILVGEVVGGLLSNSLALLSDAGHVFTDLLALLLSWVGVMQAERPASARMTFGYYRVGVLIALINASSIVVIAGVIFYEAYRRILHPEPVEGALMFVVATIGLVANLVVVMWLRGEAHSNINVRSALLHAGGDALASVGVIVGGIIILLTGRFLADPIISIAIGIIIAIGAIGIIRQAGEIILEAAPGHLDLTAMVNAMHQVPGVKNIHDLHVWTVAPQMHALSCHVLIDDEYEQQRPVVLERLNKVLGEHFDIEHSTFQLECIACDPDALYCTFVPENEASPSHAHRH